MRRKHRNVRLQDLILLALRVLVLVGAAMALARPVWSRAVNLGGTGGKGTDAVIILDTSYSMGTTAAGVTRMDHARRIAHELIVGLPAEGRVGVVTMNQQASRGTDGLTGDRLAVRAAVDDATLSGAGTDAEPALALALEMLKGSQAADRRVYLVTDGQARAFEAHGERVRQALLASDPSIRFTLAAVPTVPVANLSVADVRCAGRSFRAGMPLTFTATVRDLGERASSEAAAELWIDGRKVNRVPVELQKKQGEVSFQQTFTASGVYGIEVRLDEDGLDADNHAYAAVCIPDAADVLVVTRHDVAEGGNAFVFVEAALSDSGKPGTDAAGLPWRVRARLTGDRLASELDEDAWAVILADAGPLSSDAIRRLEAFSASGGAVLVSAGPEAIATFGSLRSAGVRFHDLLLVPPPEDPEGDAALRIRPQLTGPAVLDLNGPGIRASLESVRIWKALGAELFTDSAWAVALRYSDDRPALVVREPGPSDLPGRSAIWTSSLDGSWCDLPYRPAFVPLLHDLLGWLCGPKLIARSIVPGETWHAAVPGAGSADRAVQGWAIREPDGNLLDAALFASTPGPAGAATLSMDRTHRPGVYRLTRGGGDGRGETALQAVAVNVDVGESDPATWSAAQLRGLFPPERFDYLAGDQPVDALFAGAGSGSEIWPVVALAVLALLIAETLLAYRFSFQKPAAGAEARAALAPSGGARRSEGVAG